MVDGGLIERLISYKQEGPFWDFKREWYSKDKLDDLLIDIICMANNLSDCDAYIIIGIDEKTDYQVKDVTDDPNRKTTQNVVDFLRTKNFAGENRPIVTIEPVEMDNATIDVIVVHRSSNTPFYLCKRSNKVEAYHIYVRVQDTNTPHNESADIVHVEQLWKKRFGLHLSPLERVKSFLMHPEDWDDSPVDESIKFYRYAPEYTASYTHSADDGRNGYEYYHFFQYDNTPHWADLFIKYHQTVIFASGAAILDGGRYFTPCPETGCFSIGDWGEMHVSYKYYERDSLLFSLHCFYYDPQDGDERDAHERFISQVLVFENHEEHVRFKEYARSNWYRADTYLEGYHKRSLPSLQGYNMEFFEKSIKNVFVLQRMLEVFRQQEHSS